MKTRMLGGLGAAAAALVAMMSIAAAQNGTAARAQAGGKQKLEVWKSATCGCCAKWNEHMAAAGFEVASTDVPDVNAVKDKHGVPPQLRSCHTGLVGGYVLEGHVPADVVQKLLKERPSDVVGIAVPGMPAGSPGMEVPGGRTDSYQIIAFDRNGKTRVYASK
ncbi:MAG TPA: DUF411 domain-containing protein [Vicinamibacterales bacterium]